LTLGFYEKFPVHIHLVERFSSILTIKQLQQRLIQVFYEINGKEFTFEEIANPTIPGGKVFFEFGFADSEGFSFIDEEEAKKVQYLLAKEQVHSVDFFCGIRYYKSNLGKKSNLKFDYYLLRTAYNQGTIEFQVHHERGPRYISPEELILFIFNKINEISNRKVLKKSNTRLEN